MTKCWFTYPFLELMSSWDLSKKNILEFGCGEGTAWLRSISKWVDSIESNLEWKNKSESICLENNCLNGEILCVDLPEHIFFNEKIENRGEEYFSLIPNKRYDIVIIDGIFRDECLKWALNHFKNRKGIIIADNWQQDYVWISKNAEEIMKDFIANTYIQPDHTNHEGRPWNTTYWEIN